MKRTIRLRKLIIGFAGAAVLSIALLTAISAFAINRLVADLAWVDHSRAVLEQLEEARIQIKNAELARQDFLSTGSAAARARVQHAAETVRWTAEGLQKLTADNPARAGHAEDLATASAEIRASVETRAHRGSFAEGSPAISRAENLARSMETEERDLLAERALRERHSIDFSLAALCAEILLALIIATAMMRLILREFDDAQAAGDLRP